MEWIESSLRYLLDLHGEEIHYGDGYVTRFRVVEVERTPERPHGISYSLTLHDPSGARIMGFDNAHSVPRQGGRRGNATAHDHWHRDSTDRGRPYAFTDAATLVADFFDEVERILKERGQW
ncbi:MAG: hypothetical protein H6907_18630 [Hyphomicrobiales bacterium]|nr:hypothetical protein [Hyphomicrobiales bacterium]MCP5373750.1 hypothetical protein [Hyphomicrobiales bacterium]